MLKIRHKIVKIRVIYITFSFQRAHITTKACNTIVYYTLRYYIISAILYYTVLILNI